MPTETVTTIILAIAQPAPHVREITLARPATGAVDFRPGQWLSLHLPVGAHPPLVRAYSLAAPPNADGTLTLCFDRVENGLGSTYLFDLQPDDAVEFAPAALGNFVVPTEADTPLVLCARFTGIVPFLCALRAMPDARLSPVHLFYSGATSDELPYRAELTALAGRHAWLDVHFVIGDVDDALAALTQAADEFPNGYVPMVAGVREFTKPVRAFFIERGFERKAVKCENFNGAA